MHTNAMETAKDSLAETIPTQKRPFAMELLKAEVLQLYRYTGEQEPSGDAPAEHERNFVTHQQHAL